MSQQESARDILQSFHQDVNKPGLKPKVVEAMYDEFAPLYDIWVKENKHVVPAVAAQALAEILTDRKDAKILDAGAGTGIVGEQLYALGYTNIDALDASAGMLKQAKAKGLFKTCIQDYMGPNRLPIDDNAYDALAAAGCFAEGHVKLDCFDELLRITKPGSPIIITIAERYLTNVEEFKNDKFDETLKRYEKNGSCKIRYRKFLPNLQLNDNYIIYHLETC